MAKRKSAPKSAASTGIDDYRHAQARRKNNPPAKIAAEGTVPAIPKAKYEYNPHLPPVLRFDATGAADVLETRLSAAASSRVNELLKLAGKRLSAITGPKRHPIAAAQHPNRLTVNLHREPRAVVFTGRRG